MTLVNEGRQGYWGLFCNSYYKAQLMRSGSYHVVFFIHQKRICTLNKWFFVLWKWPLAIVKKNPHAFLLSIRIVSSPGFFCKKEKRTPFIIYWMVRETEKWSESLLRAFFSKAQQIPSKKVLLRAREKKVSAGTIHETVSSLLCVFILLENVLSSYSVNIISIL